MMDRRQTFYTRAYGLNWSAEHPGWWTATYVTARVIVDKDGDIERIVRAIVERGADIENLLASRGLRHEWGDHLEPLKALRFRTDRGSSSP